MGLGIGKVGFCGWLFVGQRIECGIIDIAPFASHELAPLAPSSPVRDSNI